MVVTGESKQSPPAAAAGNGQKREESMFSPRFRSVAEMAGWDEEALLIASLVVEDTPDRQNKHKRRTDLRFKTPPSTSRRKRRAQRRSPISIPVAVLDLDNEDESPKKGSGKEKKEAENNENADKKIAAESNVVPESSNSTVPCMDRLREELSCAICLEICFEPSTTPCGHSFCKKCLRSAADKCGKRCPKCRQLISNGRSCTVNTVLWNTIQLLFPKEVEARKASGAVDSQETECQSMEKPRNRDRGGGVRALNSPDGDTLNLDRRRGNHNLRNRTVRLSTRRGAGGDVSNGVREDLPDQDADAALALRLQREEFMVENFRRSDEQEEQRSSSIMLARANLRAMASRAINYRIRGRQN